MDASSEGAFGRDPAQEQVLMQYWSRVNGGHYTHLLNSGDMEVAFDRAETLLCAGQRRTRSSCRVRPGKSRARAD
jgi:hypothetical protein